MTHSASQWPDYDHRRTWSIRMVDIINFAARQGLTITARLVSEEDFQIIIKGTLQAPMYFIMEDREIRAEAGQGIEYLHDIAEHDCRPLEPHRQQRFRVI